MVNSLITPELYAQAERRARRNVMFSTRDHAGNFLKNPPNSIMFEDPVVFRSILQPHIDQLGPCIVSQFNNIANIPEFKLDYESFAAELSAHHAAHHKHYIFVNGLDSINQLDASLPSGNLIANGLTDPQIIASCRDACRALFEHIQLRELPLSSLRDRLTTDMDYLNHLLERNEQIC